MVDAVALYSAMIQAGVERDIVTCRSIMTVHFKQGDPDAAVDIFREFQAAGHAADSTTYHAVCQGLSNSGRFEQTIELFGEMAAAGIGHDIDTCNILIAAYCESGRIDDAIALFERLGSLGLEPDAVTYHLLGKQLGQESSQRGGAETGPAEAVEAGRQRVLQQKSTLELVEAYCRHHQFDALDTLPEAEVVADKAAARRMMTTFAMHRNADKAGALFEQLSADRKVEAGDYSSVMLAHGDSSPDQIDRYFARALSDGHFVRNRLRQTPEFAVVDLHGLTSVAAIAAVRVAFREYREVMNAVGNLVVVTGRGRGSDGGVPVLRPTVVRWLKEHRIKYRFHKGSGGGAIEVDAGSVVTWAAIDENRTQVIDGTATTGVQ